MKLLEPFGVCFVGVALIVGCSASTPVAPTPVTSSVPVARPTAPGDIRLAAITHPSGSIVVVQDCGPAYTVAGDHLCNPEWHAAFNVTSGIDISNGVLTVFFEGASGRCGELYVAAQSFGANRERLVGTEAPVFLTYESETDLRVKPLCQFPVTTDRIVVQLWDPAKPATPLVRRQFDYVSTFVNP